MPTSTLTRRTLLTLAAASAALAACDTASNAASKRVGVVGGGIIGASIAYHLAKAGG